ncbi:hypothetical protein GRAQ_01398 [Rahnella aquatilis CIP 78.65 = ATCC 33071]|nr:hypothetical protein GRAQ_01398 [Rahnella aquatilis CIP 78.65 = ATCC 33071]
MSFKGGRGISGIFTGAVRLARGFTRSGFMAIIWCSSTAEKEVSR